LGWGLAGLSESIGEHVFFMSLLAYIIRSSLLNNVTFGIWLNKIRQQGFISRTSALVK
ncbi:hypothetical protein S83_033224, partial [Arachis hypogaea]